MASKKNFIIDTNVILHDYSFIENFEENDIYIPFVVLEELDKFKKGNEQINFNARAFVRELDLITDDNLFKSGADLGVGRGKLYIVNSVKTHDKIESAFPEKTNDNRILSTVLDVNEKHPKMKSILVTKDINLRMKARSLGIPVEDYINDKVVDIDVFGRGEQIIEGINPDLIDKIYAQPTGVDVDEFTFENPLIPNDSFVLKSERNSVLARFNPFTHKIIRVDKESSFGISPRNAEQTFALGVLNDPDIKLVGITGKAGTGKTLLALAAAMKQSKQYSQILLARPIVSLSNKDLGYLPGDEKQKIAPYMQPLFDNLNVIKSQLGPNSAELRSIDEMQKSGKLEIEALAFIRGRSLSETFCIVDEAQNLTPHEVKTIITRAGQGTKIILTGDIYQIDNPYVDSTSNGLSKAVNKFRAHGLAAHVCLQKGVRSELAELAANVL